MLQMLNIRWTDVFFLVGSWLWYLLRKTGRSHLIWGIGREEVVEAVDGFRIEEDLLHGILVPQLNDMHGILVHQLHAMQGLGLAVMRLHPRHQNKGLTLDRCPLATDEIVERGLTHDLRAEVGQSPDLHDLMVQEVEVRVQHEAEVEVQALLWEAEAWVGAGALAEAEAHGEALNTKKRIEVNWMEIGARAEVNKQQAGNLGRNNYNVLLPLFSLRIPL